MKIKLGKKIISQNSKTYFIADIAANHDGNLSRAKKLIKLCAKAGANAAKFQHFKAETIVSDYGFKKLGKLTHQKNGKKVFLKHIKKQVLILIGLAFSIRNAKKIILTFLHHLMI